MTFLRISSQLFCGTSFNLDLPVFFVIRFKLNNFLAGIWVISSWSTGVYCLLDPLKCEGEAKNPCSWDILFTSKFPRYIAVLKTLLSLCFLSQLMKLLLSRQAFISPDPWPSCPSRQCLSLGPRGSAKMVVRRSGRWKQQGADKCLLFPQPPFQVSPGIWQRFSLQPQGLSGSVFFLPGGSQLQP